MSKKQSIIGSVLLMAVGVSIVALTNTVTESSDFSSDVGVGIGLVVCLLGVFVLGNTLKRRQ